MFALSRIGLDWIGLVWFHFVELSEAGSCKMSYVSLDVSSKCARLFACFTLKDQQTPESQSVVACLACCLARLVQLKSVTHTLSLKLALLM